MWGWYSAKAAPLQEPCGGSPRRRIRAPGFALNLDTALNQCEARALDWESWDLDDGQNVGKVLQVHGKLQDLEQVCLVVMPLDVDLQSDNSMV